VIVAAVTAGTTRLIDNMPVLLAGGPDPRDGTRDAPDH